MALHLHEAANMQNPTSWLRALALGLAICALGCQGPDDEDLGDTAMSDATDKAPSPRDAYAQQRIRSARRFQIVGKELVAAFDGASSPETLKEINAVAERIKALLEAKKFHFQAEEQCFPRPPNTACGASGHSGYTTFTDQVNFVADLEPDSYESDFFSTLFWTEDLQTVPTLTRVYLADSATSHHIHTYRAEEMFGRTLEYDLARETFLVNWYKAHDQQTSVNAGHALRNMQAYERFVAELKELLDELLAIAGRQ